jgi:hypothetical protein
VTVNSYMDECVQSCSVTDKRNLCVHINMMCRSLYLSFVNCLQDIARADLPAHPMRLGFRASSPYRMISISPGRSCYLENRHAAHPFI